MRLLSISTDGYRNLAGQTLELSDGINLLYGKNASGKTNTLECAYIFASGKSFRARHESELIKKGEQTARADIVLEKNDRQEKMSVIWHNSKEKGFVKRLLYEGYEVPKASEFLGIFRAVLFTPDHLSLIKGSPEERRRFMDIALSQLQPRYIQCMNLYLKIMAQKNAYLRNASITGKSDDGYMAILNEQLAKAGAVLIKQRSGFADMLRGFAHDMYAELTLSKEKLDVKYISSLKQDFSDIQTTEKRLFEIYTSDRESELKQGRTLHGPHRDDIMIYISSDGLAELEGEKEDADISALAARTFASQGQQRSAVLSIKLAEGEIFKKITGEYPVFLLDDLLGELDSDRRRMLTSLIKDRQAIITCCDKDALPDMKNVNAVEVAEGKYKSGLK